MRTLIQFFDLITSDAITLTAAAVLAVAVIGLLLIISWPASDAPRPSGPSRSATARSLMASGTALIDIARQTGLSRDAVALVATGSARTTRQNPPGAASSSLFGRLLRRRAGAPMSPQVPA